MATAQTLIDDAFVESRIADASVSPTTAQRTMFLRFFNRIIGSLSVKGVNIPYSTSENFAITSSSQTYTMGSAGTASSTRARKITNCYVRDSANNDYPVEIISEPDWNRIPVKSNTGRPYQLFYDPVYPVGVINFYYKPDASYTAYIESMKDLHSTLLIDTEISLPSEYEEALVLTLAYKMARSLGGANEQTLYGEMNQKWQDIGVLNFSQRIPQAVLPFSRVDDSGWLFDGYI